MSGDLLASILLPVYENADVLERTLAGLERQSESRFELILCDDGSGPEIARIAKDHPGEVRHVWQEDDGFRKCRALNLGVLASRSDYLIFIDQDCIAHRHFVRGHLAERRPGVYLGGRRVLLGPRKTQALERGAIRAGALEGLWWKGWPGLVTGEIRNLESAYYLPPGLRNLPFHRRARVKGCNWSCWKSDLVAINGFNEDFTHVGIGSDTDIDRRFRLMGLRCRDVRHAAIVYHQHHERRRRVSTQERSQLELDAIDGPMVCERGLAGHGPPFPGSPAP